MLRDSVELEDQRDGSSTSVASQVLKSATIYSRQATEENQEIASSRCAWLVQFILLAGALGAYTFGPLLANWSVIVAVPAEAESTTLTPKYLYAGYGVDLAYQPGSAKLYVANVTAGGLAARNGVLPGDVVVSGEQVNKATGVKSVFIWDGLPAEEANALMLEVKRFMEAPGLIKPVMPFKWLSSGVPLVVRVDMGHVDVQKGDAYFPMSIVVMRNIVGATLLSSIHFCRGGKLEVLFRPYIVKALMVPALGWSLADVFEILANGKLNADLYSVLSQSRLVGTAVLMNIMLGTKQSLLQILLLTTVTILIVIYNLIPSSVKVGHYWNGFGKPYDPASWEPREQDDPLGLLYAFGKVGLSMIMGVVGQKAMQMEELKEMPLITLQATIWIVASIPSALLMLAVMWSVDWKHGLFGGAPVEFRHCLKSWDVSRCNNQVPVTVEQGWDYRTVVVLLFYGYRVLTTNGVLRVFNALVTNLVNAGSTVAIYFMALAILGKEFNLAQCGLVFTIMLTIAQYA